MPCPVPMKLVAGQEPVAREETICKKSPYSNFVDEGQQNDHFIDTQRPTLGKNDQSCCAVFA